MGDPAADRLLTNRAIGQLTTLYDSTSPQERGRIAQTLLGFTLEAGGYIVTQNLVGVPDISATHPKTRTQLAIEAKTGNAITLAARDLHGLRSANSVGMVAYLVFPDTLPRWLFIEAHRLAPRSWQLWEVDHWPEPDLGFDVQRSFLALVGDVPARVIVDRGALIEWYEARRTRAAWERVDNLPNGH